jgi:hypothetical protein
VKRTAFTKAEIGLDLVAPGVARLGDGGFLRMVGIGGIALP